VWSGTDVLYRISSPFVKLDYIGRSNSWYRRYSEHKFEIISPDDANDSLPCYKYIRRNCHWTWFCIPFVASPDVIVLEPQFIARFAPKLNVTFNRWSKYSNSIQYCDLSKPREKTRTGTSETTRKGIDRASYSHIRDQCADTTPSCVQSYSPTYRKTIPM